jgi:diguanylate cyclase (GGDEF)-like protein/putative nucleotidyltransferase with HDIG domain
MLVLPAARSEAGLNPEKAITQYTHDGWQTEQGLPQNTVPAAVQTRDGYIWLGTELGLVRFDGVHFTVFDEGNTPEIKSNIVVALVEDHQRRLWIGTQGGGLTCLQDGKFTTYTTANGLSNDSVLSLYEDRQGNLWIGTDGGGLDRFQDGRFTVYTTKTGLVNDAVFSIAEDAQGTLWIGTHAGLDRLKDGVFTTYTTKDGLKNGYVKSVHEDRQGRLWVATVGGGLSQLNGNRFTTYTTKDGLSSDEVWTLHEDSQGSLWIGTSGGLDRFKDGRFEAYTSKQGLSDDEVWSILDDREGNLWVGTSSGGLNRLQDGEFTTFSSQEGLSKDFVLPVYEGQDGSLWVGTAGAGLNRIKDGKITTYTSKNGLSNDFVFSIAGDRDGNLWIGTRKGLDRFKDGKFTAYTMAQGLPNNIVIVTYVDPKGNLWIGGRGGLSRFQNGKFITYTCKDGLSNEFVISIEADRDGSLWIGTGGGGLNRLQDGKFTAYTRKQGLSSDVVMTTYEDAEGSLWIGTQNGGLNRFKDGKFTAYRMRQGLFDDAIFRILEDERGNLWMSSNRGVFHVSKQELNDFAAGKIARINSVGYGTSDGMKSKECNGGYQPAGWKTRDGRLCFPTMKGVSIIDPKLRMDNVRLPVLVEKVGLGGRLVDPSAVVPLPPETSRLDFYYTALGFRAPQKIRFKYKLEGFDKDWMEVGPRRVAYYTNLPPGHYRFRLMAAEGDDKWTEADAPCALYLAPRFYQTAWFYGLCAVLGLSVLVGIRLMDEQKHAENVAALHLRVIEALSRAIEAKDAATRDHVQRVRKMALAVAKQLGLGKGQMEALHAAALLHDVGKLAVPEHILTKPGKLTIEEFERMKVHPIVGAEILEGVQFPYEVVPIVRAHHERWDGSGYPDGLKAEQIPIGARILAVVDCLDALTSDRQYRPALSFQEAMAMILADAGKAFDWRVVNVAITIYQEICKTVQAQAELTDQGLSSKSALDRGGVPAAGFQKTTTEISTGESGDFLQAIASAHEEGQMLFEMSQALGNSLSLNETLSVLAGRLKRLIPHDSMAVFICKDDYVVPEYVLGENSAEFASLRIRMGEGLFGWVAANRKPIVNGNPLVEPGFMNGVDGSSLLLSALAVPLEGVNGTVGVLGLYRRQRDAFTGDNLRILQAISAKLGLSIENALKYQIAESHATVDYMTGLPNARSLFLHLDDELTRCRRLHTPLAVVVCDLDGFKHVNDRFGHLAGNKVLHSVASGLKQTCRQYDYVARLGGDEFVVIMPGFDTAAIKEKTQLFQGIAMEAGIQVCKEPVLSMSSGVAVYPNDGLDAEQLLAEADRRMYAEKQSHHALVTPGLRPLEVNMRPAAIN